MDIFWQLDGHKCLLLPYGGLFHFINGVHVPGSLLRGPRLFACSFFIDQMVGVISNSDSIASLHTGALNVMGCSLFCSKGD